MKKHLHIIASVESGSIAEELGLEPGDAIEEINGNEIEDIFDYQYYVEDEYLDVMVLTKDGEECVLEIEKDEDEDLGITFESSLMDGEPVYTMVTQTNDGIVTLPSETFMPNRLSGNCWQLQFGIRYIFN